MQKAHAPRLFASPRHPMRLFDAAGARLAMRLTSCFDRAFDAADRVLARKPIWSAVVLAVLAVQGWHVLSHIPWSDEWQALFLAVRSPDIGALLANLRYEGHPPLWYLLLRAVDSLIGWRATLPSIQLVIALAIQLLILLKAPFSRAERLLIALSYFILFEFGALARGLSFGALLTIFFFSTRRAAPRWIMVILLPAVDFQFGLLSMIGIVLLVRDRQVSWLGMSLWLLSALLSAWTVLPAPDMITNQGGVLVAAVKLVEDFSALLVPIQTLDGHLGWSGGWPWGLGLAGGLLFLLFALRETRVDPLHKWLFRFFLWATCLFSLAAYSLSIRHLTLIALLLILIKWREAMQGRRPDRAFRLWIAVAASCGLGVTVLSAIVPFDTAPAVADYIRSKGLEHRNWVAWRPERGMSVGAQLGRDFAMVQGGCTYGFIRWNFRDRIHSEADLVAALRPFVARYGRAYLVTTLPPEQAHDPLLRAVKSFEPGYDGYPYHIYVAGPDRPETSLRPPPCGPDQRALR